MSENSEEREDLAIDHAIDYEENADGWWVATVRDEPAAFSQGRTKDEARENALDALKELRAARAQLGKVGKEREA